MSRAAALKLLSAAIRSFAGEPPSSTDREIDRFVNGEACGDALLQQLYGAVADEPIPERMTRLIEAWRQRRLALARIASTGSVVLLP
jgi:hypothetical protein